MIAILMNAIFVPGCCDQQCQAVSKTALRKSGNFKETVKKSGALSRHH